MKEFQFALKNTIPIFFTYIFIGIAFGILMTDAGYGVLLTIASSVFIFAGSMQLVMVPMIQANEPLFSIALMAFFVNARHIFYGIGFVEKWREMKLKSTKNKAIKAQYFYMIFALTDETYSVLCNLKCPKYIDENKTSFFIALINHFYWILGSFLGAIVGNHLKIDMTGIDFSLTAFFLVVVVNQFLQYRSKLPFLTAAVCAVGFFVLLGKDYFLIPSLVTCLVALILLKKPIEKKGK